MNVKRFWLFVEIAYNCGINNTNKEFMKEVLTKKLRKGDLQSSEDENESN